jgi:plastocyanin
LTRELLRLRNALLILAVCAAPGLGLAACGGGVARSTGTAIPEDPPNEVEVFDFGYRPEQVTVRPRATVKWINTGVTTHTVKGEGFFSGRIDPGDDYKFQFLKPSTWRVRPGAIPPVEYRYHCTLHPRRMRGKIVVAGSL